MRKVCSSVQQYASPVTERGTLSSNIHITNPTDSPYFIGTGGLYVGSTEIFSPGLVLVQDGNIMLYTTLQMPHIDAPMHTRTNSKHTRPPSRSTRAAHLLTVSRGGWFSRRNFYLSGSMLSAAVLSPPSLEALPAPPTTGIWRRRAAGAFFFGKATVRTPAEYTAVASLVSAVSGRRTDRVDLP